MRRIVLACLLAGCYPTESACNEGPFWDGPILTRPLAASTGTDLLVVWTEEAVTDDGRVTHAHRGAMLRAPQADVRFDYEPDREPLAVLSGDDRALVLGAGFYEIRLPSGDRLGPPVDVDGFIGPCASEGTVFVVARPDGVARISPDGTLGPAIAIAPDSFDRCAATSTVTWLLAGRPDAPIEGRRLARGGGPLDATPRQLLADSYTWLAAARPYEAVIVSQDRANAMTWLVLDDNGTVTQRPLALDLPFSRPRLLVPDSDGYLLVVEDTGTGDLHAIAVSPAGTVTLGPTPFDRGRGNTLAGAHDTAVQVVFDRLPSGGEPPSIDLRTIIRGQPAASRQIAVAEGESYTVDCD